MEKTWGKDGVDRSIDDSKGYDPSRIMRETRLTIMKHVPPCDRAGFVRFLWISLDPVGGGEVQEDVWRSLSSFTTFSANLRPMEYVWTVHIKKFGVRTFQNCALVDGFVYILYTW